MQRLTTRKHTPVHLIFALTALAILSLNTIELAAQRGRGTPPPIRPGQAGALIDLTGNWVSIVSEDWRWRMLTPPKGDYDSMPLNPEGTRVADTWDLAADNAAGNQCRAFGAGAIMRTPTRLLIMWEDDLTLRIDTDNGTQTRRIHFAPENQPQSLIAMVAARPQQEATWQGYSVGQWENMAARGGGRRGFRRGGGPPANTDEPPPDDEGLPRGAAEGVENPTPGGRGQGGGTRGGNLLAMTTNLKAGYLRANGVPYSENAIMTEYFDRFTEATGEEWFVVTTIVEDPIYLAVPFVTTSHFKKEPDGAKWMPTPCETPPPTRDRPMTNGFENR